MRFYELELRAASLLAALARRRGGGSTRGSCSRRGSCCGDRLLGRVWRARKRWCSLIDEVGPLRTTSSKAFLLEFLSDFAGHDPGASERCVPNRRAGGSLLTFETGPASCTTRSSGVACTTGSTTRGPGPASGARSVEARIPGISDADRRAGRAGPWARFARAMADLYKGCPGSARRWSGLGAADGDRRGRPRWTTRWEPHSRCNEDLVRVRGAERCSRVSDPGAGPVDRAA